MAAALTLPLGERFGLFWLIKLIAGAIDHVADFSGILACSPPDRRPRWHASLERLIWPNGPAAQIFSARDLESLRGPQFDATWADELAKSKSGRQACDMLQFALRLGGGRDNV